MKKRVTKHNISPTSYTLKPSEFEEEDAAPLWQTSRYDEEEEEPEEGEGLGQEEEEEDEEEAAANKKKAQMSAARALAQKEKAEMEQMMKEPDTKRGPK